MHSAGVQVRQHLTSIDLAAPCSRRATVLRTAALPVPPPLPSETPGVTVASRPRDSDDARVPRRAVLRAAQLLVVAGSSRPRCVRAEPAAEAELAGRVATPTARYTDAANHFALEYPSGWTRIQKDGAAVLFGEPESRINNMGVTVAPVTVPSLREFGSLQFVTDKLVKAERDKDGTLAVDVAFSRERLTSDGAPVYEFQYIVQHTTRGNKVVCNAVCIDKRTLYILALQWKVGSEDKPLPEPAVAELAPRLLASFEPGASV